MDLAAGDDRQMLVEQRHERAQDAALRLTAQAEQNEVVTRENRVDQLRNDRFVVADDAGEQRLAAAELCDEVVADFVLHRSAGKRLRRRGASAAKIAERLDGRDRWPCPILSQLESRGASGNAVVAAARLRAPRRQQDRPGKHHRGVRSRARGRRRRPRARRSPLARQASSSCITTRRSIAPRARTGPLKDRTAAELAGARRASRLRDVLARYPDDRRHHRVEGAGPRAGSRRRATRCAAPARPDACASGRSA